MSRARGVAVVVSLAPAVARWTGFCLAAVSGIQFLSAWVSLNGRYGLLAGVCAVSLLGMIRALRTAVPSTRWEHLARKWGVQPADVFRTARQLAEAEPKTVFHERALQQVRSLFPRDWFRRLWETKWGLDYAVLIGGIVLFWGAVQSDGFVRRPSLDVAPGNGSFARGSDVSIDVRRAITDARPLTLEIKGKGGRWEPRPLVLDADGKYRALLRSLREPLKYRVRSGFERTPIFKLVPFDPPQIVGLVVHVTPPAYMEKKPETYNDVLSLTVWAGSRIRWRFQLNGEDSIARIGGGPGLEKTAAGWAWEETADHSFRRSIWAVRPRETEIQVAEVSVEVETDKPPSVALVGPADDVTADLRDSIPLLVELNDDVGLGSLDFVWRVNEGPWRRQTWEKFSRGTLDKWIETPWDLAPMLFNHGDHADFFFEAQDRRVPPGRGRSQTRRVSVLDVRLDQEKMHGELEQVHRALRDRVVEQRLILEDLRRASRPTGVEVSTPNGAALITQQRQFARRLAADGTRLEDLLTQMENSETVETETLMEHHALAEGLSDLQEIDLPRTDRALQAEDRLRAQKAMEQTADRLESMQKMADDSLRDQWAREMARAHEDLKYRTEALVQSLSNPGSFRPEEREQYAKTVQALESAVQRIRAQLEKLEARSDDNRGPVRKETLRFDRVAAALGKMAEALGRSDGADALAAAKEALNELEQIERQLALGGAGMAASDAQEDQSLEAARQALEHLRALADHQETLQEKTVAVVDSGRARRGDVQKKSMDLLREAAARWSAEIGPNDPLSLKKTAIDIQRALAAGDGVSARKSLTRFLAEAGVAEQGDPAGASSRWSAMAAESRSIAEALNQNEIPITAEEKTSLMSQSEEQNGLAAETRGLSESARSLALERGVFSPRISRILNDAADAMDQAGDRLSRSEPEPAVDFQSTALTHLRESETKMSDSLQKRSSPSLGRGRGQSGRRPIRINGTRETEPIPLPKTDAFRSPGTFRRDIIEGMKEPVPVDQQPAVQDYYRHWTK